MAKKGGKTKKIKEVRIVRTSDHRSHYVTGAVPQWTDDDLRLHFFNEVLEDPEGAFHVSTTQIIMPKASLQKLIDTLKSASMSEGRRSRTEVTSMPLDVAVSLDKEVFEIEKKAPARKKVQKIRRK